MVPVEDGRVKYVGDSSRAILLGHGGQKARGDGGCYQQYELSLCLLFALAKRAPPWGSVT
jgi:hypothetical protein